MMNQLTKALLILALFLSGCRDGSLFQSASDVFVAQSNAKGLYIDGRQAFIYDQSAHQTARRGNAFRLQTDDQTVYLNLQFDPLPTASSPTTSCTISARGIDGLEENTYTFNLVEERDEKMWLWSAEKKMGLIISLK